MIRLLARGRAAVARASGCIEDSKARFGPSVDSPCNGTFS